MSEEISQIRKALIEAVTAQKIIEKQLAKAREELDTWRKRLTQTGANFSEPNTLSPEESEMCKRIRQTELLIAEFQADLMSQQDLETQLKQTLFRLENGVSIAPPPKIPSIDATLSTIERMEGKVFEKEAYAELTSKDDERKLKLATESSAIEDQLAALKTSIHKRQDKE